MASAADTTSQQFQGITVATCDAALSMASQADGAQGFAFWVKRDTCPLCDHLQVEITRDTVPALASFILVPVDEFSEPTGVCTKQLLQAGEYVPRVAFSRLDGQLLPGIRNQHKNVPPQYPALVWRPAQVQQMAENALRELQPAAGMEDEL